MQVNVSFQPLFYLFCQMLKVKNVWDTSSSFLFCLNNSQKSKNTRLQEHKSIDKVSFYLINDFNGETIPIFSVNRWIDELILTLLLFNLASDSTTLDHLCPPRLRGVHLTVNEGELVMLYWLLIRVWLESHAGQRSFDRPLD